MISERHVSLFFLLRKTNQNGKIRACRPRLALNALAAMLRAIASHVHAPPRSKIRSSLFEAESEKVLSHSCRIISLLNSIKTELILARLKESAWERNALTWDSHAKLRHRFDKKTESDPAASNSIRYLDLFFRPIIWSLQSGTRKRKNRSINNS